MCAQKIVAAAESEHNSAIGLQRRRDTKGRGDGGGGGAHSDEAEYIEGCCQRLREGVVAAALEGSSPAAALPALARKGVEQLF